MAYCMHRIHSFKWVCSLGFLSFHSKELLIYFCVGTARRKAIVEKSSTAWKLKGTGEPRRDGNTHPWGEE
jgi:hypothetical protein